jgi:hypothetical protein
VHTTHEESATSPVASQVASRTPRLPTTPCSVVWSGGHSYVLEGSGPLGGWLWVGLDSRGRPHVLSPAALRDRGWSLTPG